MKKTLEEIKWLFNYMASILMYSILVLLIGVGILLAVYYVDFRFKTKNSDRPLYGAYVIVSGSMEPLIKIKDAVLIKRVDTADDVKRGDVVTYRATDPTYYGVLITHRIVDIKEENGEKIYITKGDHNETVDRSPINLSQITGKVVMRIPKIGYIKYFLVSSYGWIIAIVIPSLLVIVMDVYKLVKNIMNGGKENEKGANT